jgi:hypothetical protein
MNKTWTTRGEMLAEDLVVVKHVMEKGDLANRILLTGEAGVYFIGEIAVRNLVALNDALPSPLFVLTHNDTVRMTRFVPKVVWSAIGPKVLEQLVDKENERLGVEFFELDEWDYYQSMIGTAKKRFENPCPIAPNYDALDAYYNTMYLGALILFNKPDYMVVPVESHFAIPNNAEYIKTVTFRTLDEQETEELKVLQAADKDVDGLTNSELNFLATCYEADKRRTS